MDWPARLRRAAVTIEPRWLNVSATALPGATGVLCSRDAKLTVNDGNCGYGTINTDGTASCSDTGNCYTADIPHGSMRALEKLEKRR